MSWLELNLDLDLWRGLHDAAVAGVAVDCVSIATAAGSAVHSAVSRCAAGAASSGAAGPACTPSGAAGAASPEVFFSAIGILMPGAVMPLGSFKVWTDLSSAAKAILQAYNRSCVWISKATLYRRAYSRTRGLTDCILFGCCSTVFFGVAQPGDVIMHAPSKTSLFIVAVRLPLRIEHGDDVVVLSPGNADIFDAKTSLSVTATRAIGAAAGAVAAAPLTPLTHATPTSRKRFRVKQACGGNGVGFVIGIFTQAVAKLSAEQRQKMSQASVALFPRRGRQKLISDGPDLVDDAKDEAATRASGAAAGAVAAVGAEVNEIIATARAVGGLGVSKDDRASDAFGSESNAVASAAESDVSPEYTVGSAVTRVADATSALARIDNTSSPHKCFASASGHRKPWHHGVIVHRFFARADVDAETLAIWRRCVRTFSMQWTQYIWTYSLDDFVFVLGNEHPANVVHMNVEAFFRRSQFDDLMGRGIPVQHIKDIISMRILYAFGGWFIDFDVAWLGGPALSAIVIQRLCVLQDCFKVSLVEGSDSAAAMPMESESPQCILACQAEKSTSKFAKTRIVRSLDGIASSCYLGVTWARQASSFAQKAAFAMLEVWPARQVNCRKIGQQWNIHQNLLQNTARWMDDVAFASHDVFCPFPRFCSSFDALSEGDHELYGTVVRSQAHVAKTALMMSTWTGVWSAAQSNAAVDWAIDVAAAREPAVRTAVCVPDELSPAVRTAVCSALESLTDVLLSCGFTVAFAFEVLGKALTYLENEEVCQALVKEAAQVIGLAAGGAMAANAVDCLSAFVIAALLQACVKQLQRRVTDPTGICLPPTVSRRVLCELHYVVDKNDRELAMMLDCMFVNAVARMRGELPLAASDMASFSVDID